MANEIVDMELKVTNGLVDINGDYLTVVGSGVENSIRKTSVIPAPETYEAHFVQSINDSIIEDSDKIVGADLSISVSQLEVQVFLENFRLADNTGDSDWVAINDSIKDKLASYNQTYVQDDTGRYLVVPMNGDEVHQDTLTFVGTLSPQPTGFKLEPFRIDLLLQSGDTFSYTI